MSTHLPPPEWDPLRPPGTPGTTLPRKPIVIGAAILLAAIGYAVTSLVLASHRSVHLVNGLDVPYDVTVNGTLYTLSPNARQVIRCAEGDVEMAIDLGDGEVFTQTGHFEGSFFTRPLDRTIVVLNPDLGALIEYEQSGYYERLPPVDEHAVYTVHTGRALHTFDSIEYPFEPLPATLRIKRTETRRSVNTMAAPAWVRYDEILDQSGPEVAGAHVRLALRLDPADADSIGLAAQRLPADEVIELARPHLDERPPNLDWHMAYQASMWRRHPGVDIEGRYRDLAASCPDDATAQLLLAYSLPWTPESEALFTTLSDHEDLGERALWVRARACASGGRFGDALALFDRLRQIDPEWVEYLLYRISTLYALGQLDAAMSDLREYHQTDPIDGATTALLLELLHVSGRRAECDQLIAEYERHSAHQWASSDDERAAACARLRARLADLDDDLDATCRHLRAVGDVPSAFELAVLVGDHAGAITMLRDQACDLEPLRDGLCLAVAASHDGNQAIADEAFDVALDAMRRIEQAADALVERLRAGERITVEAAQGVAIGRRTTILLLLAAAQRGQIDRADAHAAVRRLSYDRAFPDRIVRRVLARG
ncbi:MAG: hypothetical protein KDA25_06245 [Phycisphaerales bacterium]|nr:hypothetical protein [Phycisphaerales bacterium]